MPQEVNCEHVRASYSVFDVPQVDWQAVLVVGGVGPRNPREFVLVVEVVVLWLPD